MKNNSLKLISEKVINWHRDKSGNNKLPSEEECQIALEQNAYTGSEGLPENFEIVDMIEWNDTLYIALRYHGIYVYNSIKNEFTKINILWNDVKESNEKFFEEQDICPHGKTRNQRCDKCVNAALSGENK